MNPDPVGVKVLGRVPAHALRRTSRGSAVRRRCRAAAPILAGLFLSGCFATQKDILDLSQQSDTMTLQIHSLKNDIKSQRANLADLNVKLDQLHADVSILNENLRDNRESMSRLSSKIDDLGEAIGHKVKDLGKGIEVSNQLLKETEARRDLAIKEREKELKEREEKLAAAGPSPSEVYYTASIQLQQKKFDLAAQGFRLYLEKYPAGEYAGPATFDLGQTLFKLERWEDAARQFAAVLERFPKIEATPAARLQYAMCLIKLDKNLDEAQQYLESIPTDFPGTAEAARAQEVLRSLKTRKPSKPSDKTTKKTPPKSAPAKTQ